MTTTQAFTLGTTDRRLADEQLDGFNVRLALKTAIAGSIAFAIENAMHIEGTTFGPILVFLLMGVFSQDVTRAAIHGAMGMIVGGWMTTLLAVLFLDQTATFIVLNLIWVGLLIFLLDAMPLFAIVGPILSSAMMIEYVFDGADVAETARIDFIRVGSLGAAVMVVMNLLLWPGDARRAYMNRVALFLQDMADQTDTWREAVRHGRVPPAAPDTLVVSDLARLGRIAAPNSTQPSVGDDPRRELTDHCRRLIMRRALLRRCMRWGQFQTWEPELREPISELAEDWIAFIRKMSDAAVTRSAPPQIEQRTLDQLAALKRQLDDRQTDGPVAHRPMAWVVVTLIERIFETCNGMTESYRAVLSGKRIASWEAKRAPLFALPHIGIAEVHRSLKVVLTMALLVLGELWLGLPGGPQVAFFGVFFAVTANVGLQNAKTLLALGGICSAIAYASFAIIVSSFVPHQGVMLGFLFLGFFCYMYVVHASRRFSFGALHGGLALCFAFPYTPGPIWTLATVEMRLAGLVVAGCVALLVHGVLWPSHPTAQLRKAIVDTLCRAANGLDATRVAAERGKLKPDGATEDLAPIVPQLSDLLQHGRFASFRHPIDRDAWAGMVLDLQSVVGAEAVVHSTAARLDSPDAARRLSTALDAPWRTTTDALRHLADQLEHHTADPPSANDGQDTPSTFETALANTQGEPLDDLNDARLACVARCLDEVDRATKELTIKSRSLRKV